MSKEKTKVEISDNIALMRKFYERQFDFCWENQKINYETREKLLRIYIAVLSILPALLMILYKLKIPNLGNKFSNLNKVSSLDCSQYFILIIAFFIISIFSLLTFIRNLSLHRSIIRFRKNITYISLELLKMEKQEESKEFKKILKGIGIPSTYTEEPKYINCRSGDLWLIISLEIFTALSLGLLIFIILEKLFCFLAILLICFFVLHCYMICYFHKYDIEEKIQKIKEGKLFLDKLTYKEKHHIFKALDKSRKKKVNIQKKQKKKQQSKKYRVIEDKIKNFLEDNKEEK